MALIPYSSTEKQFDRVTRYVTDHSLSGNNNNLIGYIAPTPKANRLKGEYNVTVPDLANSLIRLAKKIDPAGAVGANGTGTKTSDLEVGQPVLVSFLGNKQQPVIWGSYPFSGTDSSYEIDKTLEVGSYYPPPRHPVLDMFSGQGEIAKLKLRSNSPTQPPNSPAQVEVPGSYKYFTEDGYNYEFSANHTIQSLAGLSTRVEGKRSSIVTQPYRSSLKQSEILPFQINRDLNKVYRFVNGQFLPEEIREFPVTELLFEYVDPILEKIDLLNNFIIGADRYVQHQKEWFEESIIKPTKDLIKVWKDVIDKKDIIGALGITPLEFNFNVMGVLDKLLSIPSTGNAIIDTALQYGAQWVKSKVSGLLKQTGLLNNLEFAGGLISIGFGGAGGSNGAKYNSDLGSLLSISLPTIGAEGSALYKTIKYANRIEDEITSKVQEIGHLTSSLSTFVEGIAAVGNDLAERNRQAIQEIKRQRALTDERNDNNDEFLDLIYSDDILPDNTEPTDEQSRLSEFLDEPEPSFLETTGEIIRPVVEQGTDGVDESLYRLEEELTNDGKNVTVANKDQESPSPDPPPTVTVETEPIPTAPNEDPTSPPSLTVETEPIQPIPRSPSETNTVVGSVDSEGNVIDQSSLLEIISESYDSVTVRARTTGINSITFFGSNSSSFNEGNIRVQGTLKNQLPNNTTFIGIFDWEDFEEDTLYIKGRFNQYETEVISIDRLPIDDFYYQYSCHISLGSDNSTLIKTGTKPSHSLVTQVRVQVIFFDPETEEEIGEGTKQLSPATTEDVIDIPPLRFNHLIYLSLKVTILETGKTFFCNRVEYRPPEPEPVPEPEPEPDPEPDLDVSIEEFNIDWGADITILTIVVNGSEEAYTGRIVITDYITLRQSFTLTPGENNIQLGQSLSLIETEEEEFEVSFEFYVEGELNSNNTVIVKPPREPSLTPDPDNENIINFF